MYRIEIFDKMDGDVWDYILECAPERIGDYHAPDWWERFGVPEVFNVVTALGDGGHLETALWGNEGWTL